jgi:hypothetical protein
MQRLAGIREISPVTTKRAATKKTIARKPTLKLGRRPDPATERMAFRLTLAEKKILHTRALETNRSDSSYIRDVVVKHLHKPKST